MREPGLTKAERACGGRRDIDNAAANERAAVDDFQDDGLAVVEIEHLHPRPKRQSLVGRNQPAVMWILLV